MNYMMKDLLDSPKTSKKAKFMMRKVFEEAMLELEEAPPELIVESFERSTALMHWVGTGQVITNIPMPDGFWDFAGPQELAAPDAPLELEAGVSIE